MSRVVIIGGGASGVVAALKASEHNDVTILEGNDKLLKKLLITGNGHCNYWHENITFNDYHTNYPNMLESILTTENINDTYEFLKKIGIYPRIKNGYYYPYTNQAYSIKEIFTRELINRNVNIIYNYKVNDIIYKNNEFIIKGKDIIKADKVIISAGSKAYAKTGSDGSGYSILSKMGHSITQIFPSLVQIRCKEVFLKDLNGIRHDAKISLFIDNKKLSYEEGEVQFTDYGVSGICIFNLSYYASYALINHKKCELKLDLMPFSHEEFEKYCNYLDKPISQCLESILSYKLINVILKKCNISKDAYFKSLSDIEKNNLKEMLYEFKLNVIDTNGFDRCEVCSGGVDLKEIDKNMQSKIVNNLYITGEVLDVDGKCGGYNLAFAFISGFIAGTNC